MAVMKLLTAAITLLVGFATVVAGYQISFAEGNEAVTPDACVSLLVYKDETCSGSPMRTLTFPTYSRQSGPCYHDAAMAGYSVKDQHCDLKHGKWSQNIYVGSDTCEVKWYTQWFSPVKQVFASDKCSNGLKLDYCVKGPCPSAKYTGSKSDDNSTDSSDAFSAVVAIRNTATTRNKSLRS